MSEVTEITRAVDYCKGRIKSLENARKPLPYQKWDQHECDKITRKLCHYRTMLRVMEEHIRLTE